MDWEDISRQAQQAVINSIPTEWLLPTTFIPSTQSDVSEVVQKSGILSKKQLEITSKDVFGLAKEISDGVLTSYEVTEAFCARAAIAHQLVRRPSRIVRLSAFDN